MTLYGMLGFFKMKMIEFSSRNVSKNLPKWTPRRSQEWPKSEILLAPFESWPRIGTSGSQDAPRRPQEVSPQDGPRWTQDATKTAQDRPGTAPKTLQDGSKGFQDGARWPKTRRSQDASQTSPNLKDGSKRPLGRSQDGPSWLLKVPKGR